MTPRTSAYTNWLTYARRCTCPAAAAAPAGLPGCARAAAALWRRAPDRFTLAHRSMSSTISSNSIRWAMSLAGALARQIEYSHGGRAEEQRGVARRQTRSTPPFRPSYYPLFLSHTRRHVCTSAVAAARSGRFSVVRSAVHLAEKAKYAVKVVENKSLGDEENLEALETEVPARRARPPHARAHTHTRTAPRQPCEEPAQYSPVALCDAVVRARPLRGCERRLQSCGSSTTPTSSPSRRSSSQPAIPS